MEEYVMEYHGQEITFTEEWFGTEEKKYYFNKITSVEHIDGEEPIFKFLYDGSWMQIQCSAEDDVELLPFFFDNENIQIEDNSDKTTGLSMHLIVLTGKSDLNMSLVKPFVVMNQNQDGTVSFDSMPDKSFTIQDYSWNGPKYKTHSSEIHRGGIKKKGKDKEEGKRKGGLLGAAVGTAVGNAIPGLGSAGAAIGYAMTSKKQSKGKSKEKAKDRTKVFGHSHESEQLGSAALSLIEKNSGEQIHFRFTCNSKIDARFKQFLYINDNTPSNDSSSDNLSEKEIIDSLKEYKNLLDSGIITQDEFDKKKSELLG